MKTETTLRDEYNLFQPHLYMAFELSQSKWKLGFTIGFGQKPHIRTIKARDLAALQGEIKAAKKCFGLPEDALVLSCYEAGREGFWLHRFLQSISIESLVVDSSSIEVNRKARRAKTDKLGARKLLMMLMRYQHGEERVWSIDNAPSAEAEDHRHLHRELEVQKAERTRHINRIKGLMVGQGIDIAITDDFLAQLDTIRLWNGSPLPPGLGVRLECEYQGFRFVEAQIKALEAERLDLIRHSTRADVELVRQLLRLKGIGVGSAWLFVMDSLPGGNSAIAEKWAPCLD